MPNFQITSVDPGMVETEFSIVRFQGDEKRAKEVYANMRPQSADDVADAVYYCASRPAHVNVADLILWPTDQAAVDFRVAGVICWCYFDKNLVSR